MNEYYSSQEDYEAEMDAMNECDTLGTPVPFSYLKTSENDVVFDLLTQDMNSSKSLQLVCGIDSGMPYYEFETTNGKKRKLYLNIELTEYVIYYLINGCKKTTNPSVSKVDKNIDETYILRLFKRNREHGVSKYNPTSKEYKAMYMHGVINYGALPYTPDALAAKLNTV